MDLVDSVTQNSNNRNTTMENQGTADGDGSSSKQNNYNYHYNYNNNNNDNEDNQERPTGEDRSKNVADSKNKVPDYLRAIGMDPRKFWPKKYRFTREKSPGQHNPLTIAQRNFYESNGYIVIEDCVPRRLMDQKLLTKYQQSKQQLAPNNDSNLLSYTEDDSDFVDEFLLDKLLVKNGHLTQYVKCFCDEKFMLMTHRMIEHFHQTSRQASTRDDSARGSPNQNIGSLLDANCNRQSLFRDWIYLPFRPIDKVVCTIVALEPIEHVILVVPGTHRVGQCTISSTLDNISAAYESSHERFGSASAQVSKETYESSPENYSSLVDKSRKGFKYVNLKPGQTLFYHPGLVHGFSDDLVNFRKRQWALLAYFAAADCEFVDLRRSLTLGEQQEQATSEQQSEGEIPLSLAHFRDQDPRDYRSWLDKPRLIGEPRASL